ncbi:MAG: ABC-2 type transport system permease protein [Candidatus Azotimanducaceae bacterium]|jgi:ABC-2 type transport system permease protein
MFVSNLKFELNYHRQQYGFYVMASIVFLLFFLATATPNVTIGGGRPSVNLNAAMTIFDTLLVLSFFTVLMSISFTTNSVLRDYDYKTIEFFLSRPLSKVGFIYGRFLGSFFFGVMVYLAGLLGLLIGELMPWLDPERLGPFSLTPYLYGTLTGGLPNLFIFSCIFFCVAAITRSLAYTYAVAMVLLMLSILLEFFTDKETIQLTSILDPFGTTAVDEFTRYWTPYELNRNLPSFSGPILANRVVWLFVAVCCLFASYKFYPFSINRSRKIKTVEVPKVAASLIGSSAVRNISRRFDASAQVLQFWSQTRLEIRNIVFSLPFVIIMVFGMILVVAGAVGNLGNIAGTPVYPTTSNMMDVINGVFAIPLLAILVYVSGDMMSREHSTRSHEIMDAMPFPNWIMIAAKWVGLTTVIIMMLLAVMLAAIVFQLFNGYYDINLLQYLLGSLFFFQLPLYLMVTLSVFFYVLTRNKFITMFLMIVYVVSGIALSGMGFDHHLYDLSSVNVSRFYSDFTGYGQNLVPHLWQTLYWGLFGCLLLLAAHLLWPRGGEDDRANRTKVMRARMTRPVVVGIWVFSTAFVIVGGFIYYNTTVLNQYLTTEDLETLQADYEKAYKRYEREPQPEVQSVYLEVDIYPKLREVSAKGHYYLINRNDSPLSQIHLTDPLGIEIEQLHLPEAELIFDEALGYRIYRLTSPLASGDTMRLDFSVRWSTPGFANDGHPVQLASNGTFFNNSDLLPLIGYQTGAELQNNNTRREQKLPPVQRMPDLDDPVGRNSVGLFSNNRVDFETVVSTSIDQIAVAPGYLQKEWQLEERRYFHYKMDAPIWNFFSFMSADYEVKKGQWNDVAIEVYYKHDYNVDVMIESTKDSLEYFSKNFSPYQYRQFRILEFPRFQGRFAQSFPNTIPFSESIGFTADLRDKKHIDYVYYVTAHELAHQWWAHQVLGANVQGSTMIVETLAQYSALMVMEQKYGADHMQRFLSFELDSYLQGRGSEVIEELPLYRVENQAYVHYRKGSVVFYALRDLIGEAAINEALATFIEQYAFKGPPYPTTRNLLALIRERADPRYAEMINDMFEKIVLFDLKVNEASVESLADGGYEVSFDVSAAKFEADGEGFETGVAISDWVDIGVLGDKDDETGVPEILHLEKVHIVNGARSFTLRVDQKPASVGIDPLNKLVDRNPDDNVKAL